MNENSDLLPNLLHEDFEMQMRGYSRRQVDEFVARRNAEVRELEQRLSRTLDQCEQLHIELSAVRQQALAGRPAYEETSERFIQILKLADEEAKAQRNKTNDDIARLRIDVQQETERVRAEAREQADGMLTAAQEQAERTIAAARMEADKTRTAARSEVDRLTSETRKEVERLSSETRKKADAAMTNAKAQAKKLLDEATARASAIHDGAERRMNLLSTRHADTVRRLEDILSGVQGLVTAEAARMSLEEEVAQSVSKALGAAGTADSTEAPEPDLARLAPPAPGAVPNGNVVPPGNGGNTLPPPVRPRAALGRPGPVPNADLAGSGGSAGSGRLPMDRPAGIGGIDAVGGGIEPALPMPPISPMPPTPSRSASPGGPAPEGALGAPLPLPSGPPRSGPALPGSPQPGLGQPGPGQPVLGQSGPRQSGPGQPGLGQPGPGQPGLGQPGPGQSGPPGQAGPERGDGPKPDDGPRQERETERDGGRANIIDPDEPTEGIRLIN